MQLTKTGILKMIAVTATMTAFAVSGSSRKKFFSGQPQDDALGMKYVRIDTTTRKNDAKTADKEIFCSCLMSGHLEQIHSVFEICLKIRGYCCCLQLMAKIQ